MLIDRLAEIFEEHKAERICVLGTTCCGKTTLLENFPEGVDIDDELFPKMTKEEAEFIHKKPWTEATGEEWDRLAYKYIKVHAGAPLFGTTVVDCDVVVYLNIADEILAERCRKRGVDLRDSLNMKKAVEQDVENHKGDKGKTFYYFNVE